jgi:hypothetical protein
MWFRAENFFEEIDFSEERLLGTHYFFHLIRLGLRDDFDRLRPFIERMLRSQYPEIAKSGACLASIAGLHHDRSSDLIDEALTGSAPQRLGIAEVASANIGPHEFRDWCGRTLEMLFYDTDVEVRREAASSFRYLDGESLTECDRLIESFCNSPAFADDSFSILHAFENSKSRVPGLTCLICEKFFDRFSSEARNIQNARAADSPTVAKLVFKTYQQHQNDEWTTRALDLIDRMCIETLRDAKREIEEFER